MSLGQPAFFCACCATPPKPPAQSLSESETIFMPCLAVCATAAAAHDATNARSSCMRCCRHFPSRSREHRPRARQQQQQQQRAVWPLVWCASPAGAYYCPYTSLLCSFFLPSRAHTPRGCVLLLCGGGWNRERVWEGANLYGHRETERERKTTATATGSQKSHERSALACRSPRTRPHRVPSRGREKQEWREPTNKKRKTTSARSHGSWTVRGVCVCITQRSIHDVYVVFSGTG